jgi:hypothetical protein
MVNGGHCNSLVSGRHSYKVASVRAMPCHSCSNPITLADHILDRTLKIGEGAPRRRHPLFEAVEARRLSWDRVMVDDIWCDETFQHIGVVVGDRLDDPSVDVLGSVSALIITLFRMPVAAELTCRAPSSRISPPGRHKDRLTPPIRDSGRPLRPS